MSRVKRSEVKRSEVSANNIRGQIYYFIYVDLMRHTPYHRESVEFLDTIHPRGENHGV